MIGHTLGHYRILAKLGQGGMGEVYRAEDTRLGRQVALKVLPPEVASDPERRQRFEREARAVAALNHPNIVTIHSVEEDDGVHFLTMELVEGTALSRRIPARGMPLDELFSLATPIAEALAAAHERGVVHRDLKPNNVMVDRHGRVKILDFGLAKLSQPPGEEGPVPPADKLTTPGSVLGTLPYMSPEQLMGRAVDPRSDLFSLGVVLYEMATGRRPFRGKGFAGLISSILRDPPPPVEPVRSDLPRELERIIGRCLEKDPERRFHSALEVRKELADLRREISGWISVTRTMSARLPRPRRRRLAAAAAGMIAVVAVAVGWWRITGPAAAPPEEHARSVAVLYFDNLSGEGELDWLRYGLTDMLVTDLSQSPEIRVLATDRLYQILRELDRLDEPIVSADVVREVAARAEVDTVIVGTFARLGETVRISIRIQDAASGEILTTAKVDARGSGELFARVDALSYHIRRSFALPAEPETVAARALSEVTTSSVEAYRYYVEGDKLHLEMKEAEAIALFEKAVAVDPGFAMALTKLAMSHGNLGDYDRSGEYLRRALDCVERLSEPERAYIEGYSYSRNLETRGRAIAVYRRALARYPHLDAVRFNLANLLIAHELHDEAIELLDAARLRGREQGLQALALAEARVARGDFDDGYLVVREYLRQFPASFIIHQFLARYLTFAGRLDEAEAALARAEELRPEDPRTAFHRWHLPVLRGEWDEAEKIAERLGREKLPWRQRGLVFRGFLALFRGRSSAAAELFEQAAEAYPEAGQLRALADAQAARHLLDLGRPESALDHARAAQQAESNHWEAFVGLASEALAQQALGREAEAELAAAELVRMAEGLPGDVGPRMAHELRGRLAAARGDVAQAIVELEQAEALLPASADTSIRSRIFGPDHPGIWFALASAYLRAGKTERAAERFRRVTESPLRTQAPLEAVRSLYYLGRIHEQRGEEALARGYYRRFVDHWRDGDLDRDQVGHALRFLGAPGCA